jgi:hypothetical protein
MLTSSYQLPWHSNAVVPNCLNQLLEFIFVHLEHTWWRKRAQTRSTGGVRAFEPPKNPANRLEGIVWPPPRSSHAPSSLEILKHRGKLSCLLLDRSSQGRHQISNFLNSGPASEQSAADFLTYMRVGVDIQYIHPDWVECATCCTSLRALSGL